MKPQQIVTLTVAAATMVLGEPMQAQVVLPLKPALATASKPRFDVRVPMRDGVTLSADLWVPEDGGTFPTVLMRTPYMRMRDTYFDWPDLAAFYNEQGYAFVVQDARGRGDSDGQFGFFFDDGEDGYDTIEWIAMQPWSNGKVGMVGGSYLATNQWLAALEAPPHLTCIIPQAPAGRYFDELPYQGGAFTMSWVQTWVNLTSGRTQNLWNQANTDWETIFQHRPLLTMDSVMGRKMPLFRQFLEHPTLDEYWLRIQFVDDDFRTLDIPALTYTGWFDGDQPGAIYYWEKMRSLSPGRDDQYIIIGPWDHPQSIRGGALSVGELHFSGESVVNVNDLNLRWFDACLKGEKERFEFPRARVYTTGSNVWHHFENYPPKNVEMRDLFLHSGGNANTLGGNGVLDWSPPGAEPPDRYTYNPRHPAPAGGALASDQRAIERRDDVLVYTTDPLDEPLTVMGRVFVMVHAETDGLDTDFTGKLVDVHPDGRAVRLGWRQGIKRARYLNGYTREQLIEPGRAYEYAIELFDIGHTFMPGHRIRVEISSSAYPAFNPNQNTGNPVATDTEWRVAAQTVYHDRDRPSRVRLPVLPFSLRLP